METLLFAIFVYLAIGLAHWVSHTMSCQRCRSFLYLWLITLQESLPLVFGWPMDAIHYLIDAVKPKREITLDDVQEFVRNHGPSNEGMAFKPIEMRPISENETQEEFETRIRSAFQQAADQAINFAKEHDNVEPLRGA